MPESSSCDESRRTAAGGGWNSRCWDGAAPGYTQDPRERIHARYGLVKRQSLHRIYMTFAQLLHAGEAETCYTIGEEEEQ